MDQEDVVSALVTALHAAQQALAERSVELRTRPEWADVAWELELTESRVGVFGRPSRQLGFWGHVEGDLSGRGPVNWSFGVIREGRGWIVEREQTHNADDGPGHSETLVRLDDVQCVETMELVERLPSLITELLAIPEPSSIRH